WAPRDRAPARLPAREARAARVAGRGRRARARARLALGPFLRPPTGTHAASARGLAADDKQVSGEPQQRRRAPDGAGGPEEALALDGIGPPRLEVGQEPGPRRRRGRASRIPPRAPRLRARAADGSTQW